MSDRRTVQVRGGQDQTQVEGQLGDAVIIAVARPDTDLGILLGDFRSQGAFGQVVADHRFQDVPPRHGRTTSGLADGQIWRRLDGRQRQVRNDGDRHAQGLGQGAVGLSAASASIGNAAMGGGEIGAGDQGWALVILARRAPSIQAVDASLPDGCQAVGQPQLGLGRQAIDPPPRQGRANRPDRFAIVVERLDGRQVRGVEPLAAPRADIQRNVRADAVQPPLRFILGVFGGQGQGHARRDPRGLGRRQGRAVLGRRLGHGGVARQGSGQQVAAGPNRAHRLLVQPPAFDRGGIGFEMDRRGNVCGATGQQQSDAGRHRRDGGVAGGGHAGLLGVSDLAAAS